MRTVSPVSWAWLREPFERMVRVDMHRLMGPSYALVMSPALQPDAAMGVVVAPTANASADANSRRNDAPSVADARQVRHVSTPKELHYFYIL
jgi:hypothetical protein